MIPKKIHYCWFGRGEMPERLKNYMSTWRKYMPDYEIKEWNEDNFDVNSNQYIKEAYEARKLAFVTDYVRLHALATEGGIYMDADVEVLRPLDRFLRHRAFTGYESRKGDGCITGTMGSEAGGKWVSDLLSEYGNRKFVLPDGSLNMVTNVTYTTNYMKQRGVDLDGNFQEVPDLVTLYPFDFFCVKNMVTGEVKVTDNSYTIHHFAGSWHTPYDELIFWTAAHIGRMPAQVLSLLRHSPVYIVKRLVKYWRDGK